jgi:LDH2 family malate/lactate/ureidoglycolate dehydrogenase
LERKADGIPLMESVVNDLSQLAHQLGVNPL